uniref:Atp binding n=1 Tax=Tetraselmis sp. GSL018 TaxID=582737 RepID=A0A061QPN8_9CHLO
MAGLSARGSSGTGLTPLGPSDGGRSSSSSASERCSPGSHSCTAATAFTRASARAASSCPQPKSATPTGSATDERDAYGLRCRLRDLAFAVDVSDEALMGGATLSEIWERGSVQSNADPKQSVAEALWQRARREGAWSGPEKRAFGIADDVYAAGLLLAYMCLVPLSEPGSIDGPSIQRLFETTYQLDIESGARDFCEAEDRWATAVEFLGSGDGLGWDLFQRMMHPNWRQRPSAQECLDHPFLKGEYLG